MLFETLNSVQSVLTSVCIWAWVYCPNLITVPHEGAWNGKSADWIWVGPLVISNKSPKVSSKGRRVVYCHPEQPLFMISYNISEYAIVSIFSCNRHEPMVPRHVYTSGRNQHYDWIRVWLESRDDIWTSRLSRTLFLLSAMLLLCVYYFVLAFTKKK